MGKRYLQLFDRTVSVFSFVTLLLFILMLVSCSTATHSKTSTGFQRVSEDSSDAQQSDVTQFA